MTPLLWVALILVLAPAAIILLALVYVLFACVCGSIALLFRQDDTCK